MIFIEITLGLLIVALGILSSASDLKEGIVRNRLLLLFLAAGLCLDAVLYVFFARDLILPCLVNLLIVSAVSLLLFYTHSFAGGDCKLTVVLAVLYPARFYCLYEGSDWTLIFALGIGIFYGYLYLLAGSLWALVNGKNSL